MVLFHFLLLRPTGGIAQITCKLNKLLSMVEDPNVTPAQRLALLREVAEDSRSFKLGGEDKIRVATGTCGTVCISYFDTLSHRRCYSCYVLAEPDF
jgi:hypothetical protein